MTITRRDILTTIAASAPMSFWTFTTQGHAQSGEIILGIPLDSSNSLPFLVAETAGYFKEQGINSRVTTGAAGSNVRNMVAAGEMPYSVGDMVHPLYLSGAGKQTKVLMALDKRASVNFIIRQDHWDAGIRTMEDLAKIRRPNGAKVIVGTTRPGSQAWLYGSHLCRAAGVQDLVNFVSTGDASTMLGSFRAGQVDAVTAFTLVNFAIADEKLGMPLFDAADQTQWNKYYGSNFPALCVFGLETQVKASPKLTQGVINAAYKALLHISKTSADDLAALVQQKFMQGFKREVAVREISFLKPLFEHDGLFAEADFNNGAKIWFGEVTNIRQQKFSDLVDFSFLRNAHQSVRL